MASFSSVRVVSPLRFWELMGRPSFVRHGPLEGTVGSVLFVTPCAPERILHAHASKGFVEVERVVGDDYRLKPCNR